MIVHPKQNNKYSNEDFYLSLLSNDNIVCYKENETVFLISINHVNES